MLRYQRFGCETRASFAPFRFFRVADIFAYMSMFDLPIHPNYAMVGGGRWDRNRIRVTSIGNREGTGHGRAEWEREYYGDVLARIESGGRMSRGGADGDGPARSRVTKDV